MKPLDVECPRCGASAGTRCFVWYRDTPQIARGQRWPHAARVRAAQAQEKKEGDRG